MPANGTLYLKARWVLPISSPGRKDAVLVVENGTISQVLSAEDFSCCHPGKKAHDYGQAIILPGLINLHTHLDYSALRLFDTRSALFDWIDGLLRRARAWTAQEWLTSARSGAREVALSGTTCIVDSSYTGMAAACAMAEVGLRGVVGLELFGLNGQLEVAWRMWLEKLESLRQTASDSLASALESRRIQLTCSPHAPYTVHPDLWARASQWTADNRLPLMCHVAESIEECQWLESGNSRVDKFLESTHPQGSKLLAAGFPWKGKGHSPVSHLAHHDLLRPNTLCAHVVHLSRQDIGLLSQNQVKVAHCPRSNARLRNGISPVKEILEAGVALGFGTDSAASTDDLNILNEARFAWNVQRAKDPECTFEAEDAVYRLTLGAATMLNLEKQIGSLEAGKFADLAVFALPDVDSAADPFEVLLYGNCKLIDVFVEGQPVVKDGYLVSAGSIS